MSTQNMKTLKNVTVICTMAFLSAFLSACGSKSKNLSGADSQNQSGTGGIPTYNGGNNTSGLPTAPSYSYYLSGSNGPKPVKTFMANSTESTLRIKVTANTAQPYSGGYVSNYGCVRVSIKVNGVTRQSPMISVPGVTSATCAGSPSSYTFDFSDMLTGFGPVFVEMNAPMYDNIGGGYASSTGGGPMKSVVYMNEINGSVQVQTDGYWMQ